MINTLYAKYPAFVRKTKYWAYRWMGESRLSKSQINLLKRMRQDNFEAGLPFRASAMWSELSYEFDKIMQVEGISIPEAQLYNTMFSQSLPTSPRYYRYALWMLYCNIKQKDKFDILGQVEATVDENTGLAYVFEGKRVSWDLLISIDTLYALNEVYPALLRESVVVADLGAGWGRIGYVLKKVNPKATYIIFDLPEPLLISMTGLPKLLPNEQFFSYLDIQKMPKIPKSSLMQGALWFCGSQDLLRCEDQAIDVFINIASFQEMTKEQVMNYFSIIDRKVKGIFYTQQYWVHHDLHAKYEVINGFPDYPIPSNWSKLYVRTPTFSERYFEAAFSIGL